MEEWRARAGDAKSVRDPAGAGPSAGTIIDKDDLLKRVWPDTFVNEETLTQNISTLRKALGDTADQPEYIATIPRRGYQFISPVAKLANSQPLAADALPR